MTTKTLSARLFLEEAPRLRFVRPKLGEDLQEILGTASPDSLAAEILSVRRLILFQTTAIPFHIHPFGEKEKLYLWQSGGKCTIHVQPRGGGPLLPYVLDENNTRIIVPAGVWHAIVVGSHDVIVLVVASTRNTDDIQWEQGADELLKNEHLNR